MIVNQKLNKKSSEILQFTVDFTDLLGDYTITSIDNVTITPSGLGISSESIISVETTVDNVIIEAGKGIQFVTSDGNNRIEYELQITFTNSHSEQQTVSVVIFITNNPLDYYGSIVAANDYFALQLRSDPWNTATKEDKLKALIQATNAIDRLNFAGSKNTNNQLLQFPRGQDTIIPQSICFACYEIAKQLLDEIDVEIEKYNLSVVAQGVSSVRNTYDRTFVPENIRAGIMSSTAWDLIIPYLRDPGEITLSRV